jgi:hypothetical protein
LRGFPHQTITGWEAVAFALEPGNPAFANLPVRQLAALGAGQAGFKDELFDLVVNDLGKKEFATEDTATPPKRLRRLEEFTEK